MKKLCLLFLLFIFISTMAVAQPFDIASPQAKTLNGMLQGTYSSGINIFKGVPFAAPPVGNFRWREPQPVKSWTGVRKADKFGPRAMQLPILAT